MNCEKKLELQQACSAAWNEFEGAVADSASAGVRIDARSGAVAGVENIGNVNSSARRVAHLRLEHLRASAALSRHLSSHRC